MKHQGPLMTPEQIADLPYRPCVGVMLANTRGHIFVGQRNDRDTDAWQMPQGGVDKGENCRDAALRELEEDEPSRTGGAFLAGFSTIAVMAVIAVIAVPVACVDMNSSPRKLDLLCRHTCFF